MHIWKTKNKEYVQNPTSEKKQNGLRGHKMKEERKKGRVDGYGELLMSGTTNVPNVYWCNFWPKKSVFEQIKKKKPPTRRKGAK